jgi:hypothetical protein
MKRKKNPKWENEFNCVMGIGTYSNDKILTTVYCLAVSGRKENFTASK